MTRIVSSCLCAVLGLSAWSQAEIVPAPTKDVKSEAEQQRYGYMAPAQDAYQGAWNVGEAQHTAELWRALCEARPADPGAQWNWFRSERNARLGQNNGKLSEADKTQLNTIAGNIERAAPGSFEQAMSSYYMAFPARSAYTELEKANTLDGTRTELILPMVNRANANGDKASLDSWTRQLEARGELSPALGDVAVDLLNSTDVGAVLFTNGDMDGAPVLVQQRLHDVRRDVLLVDQRLLQDATYRNRIWQEAKATGPVPGPGPTYADLLGRSSSRPVFLALSLDRTWLDAFAGRLCATGIAFKVDGGACDMAHLEQRWSGMRKNTQAGPLGRNYLLPGALLLQHYRTRNDETKASRLEAELRTMGRATGATTDLIKSGVLAH